MLSVEPGKRCSRCFQVGPSVRVEATCLSRFFQSHKGGGETPLLYLCLDCLREAVALIEEFTK